MFIYPGLVFLFCFLSQFFLSFEVPGNNVACALPELVFELTKPC